MRKVGKMAVVVAVVALGPAAAFASAQVQALGGYRSFAKSEARDVLDGGPAYGVGLSAGVTPFLGIEGWYQGATYETAAGLTAGERRVYENGVAGVLKLGPQDTRVRPYAFGGAEWDWFRAPTSNTVVQDQNHLTVPLGAGVDVDLTRSRNGTGVTLGARGSYRLGFGEDVFRNTSMNRADQFQVAAVLGAQF